MSLAVTGRHRPSLAVTGRYWPLLADRYRPLLITQVRRLDTEAVVRVVPIGRLAAASAEARSSERGASEITI